MICPMIWMTVLEDKVGPLMPVTKLLMHNDKHQVKPAMTVIDIPLNADFLSCR